MTRITPLTITKRMIGEGESPLLSVVMIDSRSKKLPDVVLRAINSIENQAFAKHIGQIEFIIVNNQDRFHTIGKCFNKGISESTCEWVMMMGDDDYITPDYLMSLWVYANHMMETNENVTIVTSFSTYIDDEKEKKALVSKAPMGMYNREYAYEQKFDETLSRYVDIDFMERTSGKERKMFVCPYHFGYHYHQHEDNVSGRKVIGNVEKSKEDSNVL